MAPPTIIVEEDNNNNKKNKNFVPRAQYGENSPRRGSRLGPRGVWVYVKRLRNSHPEFGKRDTDTTKKTHCCIYSDAKGTCYQLLRLHRHKTKGSWNTTEALLHFKKEHPDSEIGRTQTDKEKRKVVVEDDAASQWAKKTKKDVTSLALASAARFYVFSKQFVSKRAFEDKELRGVLDAYYQLGGGAINQCPRLTLAGLRFWIRAEFASFVRLLKHVVSVEAEAAEGNGFGQLLRDGVALEENRSAVGFSFIPVDWDQNLVVCLGLPRIADSLAAATRRLEELVADRLGIPYDLAVAQQKVVASDEELTSERKREGMFLGATSLLKSAEEEDPVAAAAARDRAGGDDEKHPAERRSERILQSYDQQPTDRELAATLLDFRTVNCAHLTPSNRVKAEALLRGLYVEYAATAHRYRRENKKKKKMQAAFDDDDDDDDGGRLSMDAWLVATEETPVLESMPDFGAEFDAVFVEWLRYAKNIRWKKEYPDELENVTKIDVATHLLHLHVGKLYQKIENDPKYGYLPRLARASRGSIGVFPAKSFCDRVLSAGKIVLHEGASLLDPEELDMVVVLRLNRMFMEWGRAKYGAVVDAETLIPADENEM